MSPEPRRAILFTEMLKGGDRRSIGKADLAVAMVLEKPELFGSLFSGMLAEDPVIRMRCADAAEKVTQSRPEYLAPYKNLLLKTLAQVGQAEVRWHVAPMLARLPLSKAEQSAVGEILTGYLEDRSSIVRTMAMQALFDLAQRHQAMRSMARRLIEEALADGTPAMRARGKKLLAEMDRMTRD